MFLVYGTRRARIKKFKDAHEVCGSCNAIGVEVSVYRDVAHCCVIPIFPIGENIVTARCLSCGKPVYFNTSHYQKTIKAPFFAYSFLILLAAFILLFVKIGYDNEKEKEAFFNDPKVGDVYAIRKNGNNETSFYFFRLASVKKDAISVYMNTSSYSGYVSDLWDGDYFVKELELTFPRSKFKEMLDKGEIYSIERDYKLEAGFNRIK
ncbi:MAG: hypothetical protein ACKOXB_12215 [Flavobacteriales bacterium]